jgi:glycosyltransferase involved in cell wall biosynthesis
MLDSRKMSYPTNSMVSPSHAAVTLRRPKQLTLDMIGLTTYSIHPQNGVYKGKGAGLFNTLAQRYNLQNLYSIEMSRQRKYYHYLTNFRTNRTDWSTAARMNVRAFWDRSKMAEAYLQQHENQYDVIFQQHTMMAPGVNYRQRSYVIATDNTYRLSERYWPDWVPLHHEREEWIAMETDVFKHAACIFTWSDFARQSFIRDYGIDPDKVVVTGSSSNVRVLEAPKDDFSEPIAMFVGYDFERKGGYVLLEAWKRVRAEIPNAQLWIIGPKKPLADPMPGVHWLGRIHDSNELEKLYSRASAFLLPSLFEPFAFAILEAMGVGLPCITSNDFGVKEMIQDGVDGLLVNVGDPDSLAEAVIKLLGNPEYARMLGHAGHHNLKQRFTWTAVVDRMMPTFQRITADRKWDFPSFA